MISITYGSVTNSLFFNLYMKVSIDQFHREDVYSNQESQGGDEIFFVLGEKTWGQKETFLKYTP